MQTAGIFFLNLGQSIVYYFFSQNKQNVEIWLKALVEISLLSCFRLIFSSHEQFGALEYDIGIVIPHSYRHKRKRNEAPDIILHESYANED
jgi:hypothetical protein